MHSYYNYIELGLDLLVLTKIVNGGLVLYSFVNQPAAPVQTTLEPIPFLGPHEAGPTSHTEE